MPDACILALTHSVLFHTESSMPSTMNRVAVLLLLFTTLPCSASSAQRRDVVAVGTASATRGALARGIIQVPAGVDSALSIPVVVINGARPGPVLAIVSGAH